MFLYGNNLYCEDITHITEALLSWKKLQNKSVLLSGVPCLLGSFLLMLSCRKMVLYGAGATETCMKAEFGKE